jgi:thymidylate synthase
MTIYEPLLEPRIHRCFPGGPKDLKEYVDEVCLGTKNKLVRNKNDINDTRWQYTYNLRLFSYDVCDSNVINQIDIVADKIAKCPNTRRAQVVTWKVWEDNFIDDPACLQSMHFRGIETDNNTICLNTNIRMRSNDAYKAAFMNLFAFIELINVVSKKIESISGKRVILGRVFYQVDSYHIYGKDLDSFENGFLKMVYERVFENRTYNYETYFKELMYE